ncbi:ATP-binding protein [uncultured Draconibacterium sp.]|uniref:ATP-binding protein n=1 Tax=uncultured Draconibacterium sp. TaxID=1573823 RepID=UPI0029C6E5A9|nr:ATP-binding protein [uncultured Draconibacterium sp.]
MVGFRTKARAVDLLGKGQISDLPTAISELWKNGYDAYGDKLGAHLYLEGYSNLTKPLFLLSDDGTGMSSEDILDKWIVLGTDSKSRGGLDIKGEDTLNKPPRIKMGEKGIGRLSVAYLGSPMLMLTKKKNDIVQLLYFDWRILENYNLFIDDINIPIKSLPNLSDIRSIFNELKEELLDNLSDLKNEDRNEKILTQWYDQLDLREEIISENEEIELPDFFEDEILIDFKNPESHGTKFLIYNPDEQLLELAKYADKKDRPDYIESSINEIRATLSGLFNVFKKEEENNKIKTSFFIKSDTGEYDFISSREFFTHEDFEICDHLIDGDFDENGTFKGTIRVFKQPVDYSFRNTKPLGKVPYGPFKIKVGVSPGKGQATIMNEEQFKLLDNKLKLFGGLYIYRDNFRVLPYGKTEVDFLNFEKRRTFGAGYYFFSHRRMFGFIDISRIKNEKLKDKAGREGFIANQAYREFKADLEAFFIDLAKQFFATDAKSDLKEKQQTDLKKQAEAEKKEKEREKEERREFSKKLTQHPKELKELQQKIESDTALLSDLVTKSSLIYDEIRATLGRIEKTKTKLNSLILSKPTRFKLTENQEKKFFNFNNQIETFFNTSFISTQKVIEEARSKLEEEELLKEYENLGNYYQNLIKDKFYEFSDTFKKSFNRLEEKLKIESNHYTGELKKHYENYYPKEINKKAIKNSLNYLEKSFNKLQIELENKIPPLFAHLNRLSFDVDEDQLTGFYKVRFEEIEKQWQETKELAQLGIAVEIIDHQFNALYSQLANTINKFQLVLSEEKSNIKLYKELKTAFEHLESKYKLLSPLYRTTGKTKTEFNGQYISNYIETFFSEQFEDNAIKFRPTPEFNEFSVHTFESILLPVFINVVHNAVYWLTSVNERKIVLDVKDSEILIMNSGAQIEDFYLDKIFDLFYSKRPNGRGIGLYLAKENLNSIGYDIFASNDKRYNILEGACFIIKKL